MTKMLKLYDRIIPLEIYTQKYEESVILIKSNYEDQRNKKIMDNLAYKDLVIIDYTMKETSNSTTNSSIEDIINVTYNKKEFSIQSPFDEKEIRKYILALSKINENIFIDITGLSMRFLAMLLSKIKEAIQEKKSIFRKIFCGYTETKEYLRNNFEQMFGSNPDLSEINTENIRDSKCFSLYKTFAPIEPIPYLSSLGSDDIANQIWIVILGYEGNRTTFIQNELSKVDRVIALLTVPPIRPGWNNFAFDENAHFLEGVDNAKPLINYVSANSPFPVYNYLRNYQKENENNRIILSPLSTKATSLGTILYALNNPMCALRYDNPYEMSRDKVEEPGKTYVYDITEALQY